MYYKNLDRVVVVDRLTFEVHWKIRSTESVGAVLSAYPLPYWLYSRTNAGEPIPDAEIGASFASHHAGRWGVGVGPYQLSSYDLGAGFSLMRHPGFRGEVPAFDRIDYKTLGDRKERLMRFEQGQLDVHLFNSKQFDDMPAQRKREARFFDMLGYSYIGWNAKRPFFKDKLVRQAMTHAFNRRDLIESVYSKLGAVQTGPFFYKHPANDPEVQALPFDLEKAKALLDEAGWKDLDGDGVREKVLDGASTPLSFTILCYSGSAEWSTVMSVFQEDLRKIGVAMSYSRVDWPAMQVRMTQKKFDAFTGGWGLGWDIDPYQIWHSSQADAPKGSNRVDFRSQRADAIIETLRVTFDMDERIKLLREFHKIVHEEQPYTFFRSPKIAFLTSSKLATPPISKVRPHLNPLRWHFKKP